MHYHFAPQDEKAWRIISRGKGRNGREIEENNTEKGVETTTEEGELQQRVVKTIKLRDSRHGIVVYCSIVSISTGGEGRKRDGPYRREET